MINCIMQNNSRNYSGISHAHFLHHNIIPFSGFLGSGFIYILRNDIIKQVTFWGKSDSISLLLPDFLPASISTHLLSLCFRKLFNSSLSPDREKQERKKTNEMLSWEKGRSRSKDKIRRKNEKRHNTGGYTPIPSSAKKKIKTNTRKKNTNTVY